MIRIYHNPRCRKSRETLNLLLEKGIEPLVIEYLSNPPSRTELEEIIGRLGIKAENLVRKGESLYKEQFKGNVYSDQEWIELLVNNPKLIERPIVDNGAKAAIGRPPENVLQLLS